MGDAIYAASRIQEVMWHANETVTGCGALSGCLMVRGSFDGDWLERCVKRLAGRHGALRTAFRMRAGVLEAVVGDDVLPSFETHDASTWSEEELSERISAYLSRPFDLGVAPLCGLAVFVKSSTKAVVALRIHHSVFDGRSLAVLVEDLCGMHESAEAPLPEIEAEYEDYAQAEYRRLGSEEGAALRQYWTETLAGQSALELPRCVPDRGGLGETRTILIEDEILARLTNLGRKANASFYTILLAACFAVFQKHAGQSDITIGSPVSLRYHRRFGRVCGPLYDYIPIRAAHIRNASFGEHLESTKVIVRSAFAHAGYSIGCMLEDRQLDPARGVSPIFQVMLNVLAGPPGITPFVIGESGSELTFYGVRVLSLPTMARFIPFEQNSISIVGGAVEGGVMLRMFYDPAIHAADRMQEVLEDVVRVLRAGSTQPEERLSHLTEAQPFRSHRMMVGTR